MRIVQRVLLYLMSVALLVVGALLFLYPSSELYRLAIAQLPHGQPVIFRYGLACVVLAVGVFSLLPFDYFARKRRCISFPAEKGRTVIELEWFETALKNTLAKLPIVKRADIIVTPVEKDTKVEVEIKVALKKSDDESTRDASDRLRKFADEAARSILGPNEVKTVEVHITTVQVDTKKAAQAFGKFPATPIERPAQVAAAAVAAAPIAGAAGATSFAQDDDLDQDDYEVVEEEPEVTDASVPSHSDDLLTYDEATSLQSHAEVQTDAPATDHVTDSLSSPVLEPVDSTSFEAINEEPNDKTPNRDHE